ncbi:hypothetical protein TEA_025849 [Camellia sinensis var. sinensis]|uniref:Uncharacterized protein n=1 Tax=Camellia sinensis var. sinensis TaxID=542762 RepID=A0A4S4DWA6_CAMSN|nr:hypothetical protein TEA_025849 [Camellia sinensis var. sinensis]
MKPLAMPSTAVSPITVFSWPDPATPLSGSFRHTINAWQPITSPMEDDYGRDYWHARRAFLTSYHFSERKNTGFKEKMKKSLKGLNEVAMKVFLPVRGGMYKRKIGVRVYRFTVGGPTLFIVRCFVPWAHKDQQYLNP